MMRSFVCILFLSLLFSSFLHAQPTDNEYEDPAVQLLKQHVEQSQQVPEAVNTSVDILKKSGFLDQCKAETGNNEIMAATLALLLLISAVLGLAYMFGSFLNSPVLIAFVKNEIPEAIISVILMGLIAFILKAFPVIFGVDVFASVLEYNMNVLLRLAGSAGAIISAYMLLSSAQTLFLPIGMLGKSITLQLGPAMKPLFDGIITVLRVILVSYGMWVTHLILFCMIKRWFFTIFLPIAFFLRIVPPTRGIGNALIAIVLAFLIAYPFMFYLDSKIFNDDMARNANKDLTWMPVDVISNLYRNMTAVKFGFTMFFFFILFMTTGGASFFATLGLAILNASIHQAIKLTFIYSVVIPVINIYVTLTFAREIAKHLGTELSIAPLVRLI